MDCVVLAGSGHAYKDVKGSNNKAFLTLNGKPIMWYVLNQLIQVERIERIMITGPREPIEQVLAMTPFVERIAEKKSNILVFDDLGDVLNSALNALEKTGGIKDPNRWVFVVPSDIPFARKGEVEQFLDRCELDKYDFFSGVVSSKALSNFYPTETLPGIKMAYFHTAEEDFRISNMHLARVANIHNLGYLRKTYSMRYLKKLKNIVWMVFELSKLCVRIPGAISFFLNASLTGILYRKGYQRLPNWLRKRNRIHKPESYISKILETRFKIVPTDYGAMALDIDNDTDFDTIRLRFEEWNDLLDRQVGQTHSQDAGEAT